VITTWFRVRSEGSECESAEPLLNCTIENMYFAAGGLMGNTIRGLRINPEFLRRFWPLLDPSLPKSPVRHLDLTALTSCSLTLSRMLYMVIGNGAAFRSGRTSGDRFRKDLKAILDSFRWPCPLTIRPSRLKRILCRPDLAGDVLRELDNLPLLNGRLRVELEPNCLLRERKGSPSEWDYVLSAWCEGRVERERKPAVTAEDAATHRLFQASGLEIERYVSLCNTAPELSADDIEALLSAGCADWHSPMSQAFFRRAKGLLGAQVFLSSIGDTRVFVQTGGTITKSSTAKVITDLLDMVQSRARRNALGFPAAQH